MTSSGVNTGSKPAHITMPSSMPMEKIKSYGEFGAYVQNSDLTFSQFTSLTKCGSKQSAYKLNKAASDYIPRHEFTNTVISDVEDDAMFYLQDPV
jgi:cysteine synthase